MPALPEHRKLLRAFEKRRALIADTSTNAYRLVDGEADGFPGLTLDAYDDVWLWSTADVELPRVLRRAPGPALNIRAVYHKRLDQRQKDSPVHVWGEQVDAPFWILEKGMRFEISMQAGYSQGIFLDQRDNRQRVREAVTAGQRLLNTFSYTCAFSIAAALGGAITTSLDLSNPYLAWGKRHFLGNGLDPNAHYFCKGDALTWMQRFAKQGRQFAGVILDPPTFSRSEAGVFRVQKDYGLLVEAAAAICEPSGWILATCNDRQLSHERFATIIEGAVGKGMRMEPTSMPSDFVGEPYLKSLWIRFADP